jgi:hypothetical protein
MFRTSCFAYNRARATSNPPNPKQVFEIVSSVIHKVLLSNRFCLPSLQDCLEQEEQPRSWARPWLLKCSFVQPWLFQLQFFVESTSGTLHQWLSALPKQKNSEQACKHTTTIIGDTIPLSSSSTSLSYL